MEYCALGSLDVYLEENEGEVELKDKLVEVPRTVLENCGKLLEQSLEAIAKSHDIAEESAATFCLQKPFNKSDIYKDSMLKPPLNFKPTFSKFGSRKSLKRHLRGFGAEL